MPRMGKYLYCFIKEKEKKTFGVSQIAGLNAPVYTINVDEISAVISEAPIIDYDPSRKNTIAHQKVIGRVMDSYTTIPVAFGTVANNKKEVEAIIKSQYRQFLMNINKLNGKIELGLKVKWDKTYFDRDVQDKKISKLNEKIHGKAEEEVYTDKIRLGKLVEASIQSKRKTYLEDIYFPLEKIAIESKFNDKLAVNTILNAYFLVDKTLQDKFDKEVEKIATLYKGKLVFSYTGPWAPYNFVDMHIDIEDMEEGT